MMARTWLHSKLSCFKLSIAQFVSDGVNQVCISLANIRKVWDVRMTFHLLSSTSMDGVNLGW